MLIVLNSVQYVKQVPAITQTEVTVKTPRLQGFWPIIAAWLLALGLGFAQTGRVGDYAASGMSDVFHPKGGWIPSDDHAIPNLPVRLEIGMGSGAVSRERLSKFPPNRSIARVAAKLSRHTPNALCPRRSGRLTNNLAGADTVAARSKRQAAVRLLYVGYPSESNFGVNEGRNHA